MAIENTDLERRVLAHEQILQVLIAHMAETEPKFLDRLQEIFTEHHTLGAEEQDYTDTAAYAQQFIHQVVRLKEKLDH
jgi:transcription termination factor NusB